MTLMTRVLPWIACGWLYIGCAEAPAPDNTDTDNTDTDNTDTDNTDTDDTDPPAYTVEGRWVESTLLNTMYEFDGSVRRTFYCVYEDSSECDAAYWASLDGDDAIPGEHPYTFDGTTLTIDLFHGNTMVKTVTFACAGKQLLLEDYTGSWHRPDADLSDCPDE